ncbi:MAG: FecR family protein, partial [Elusimicrobiales bacterium]|nr:FecR family protein [Elusimicrobiales bacterium]
MSAAKLLFLPLFAVLAAAPCAAQSDEYRKMLDEAMKSGGPAGGQPVQWDARLKKISGEVLLKSSEAAEWVAVGSAEVPLDPDDSIKTGSSGAAEIYLENQGVIALGRNTEFEVRTMEKEDTSFRLVLGSIIAKIEKFAMKKRKLSVRTPSAVCAVRGTEFAVEHS